MLRFCLSIVTVLTLAACASSQPDTPANPWKAVTLAEGEKAPPPSEAEDDAGASCARKSSLKELWSSCLSPR
jgi:hypothetical protein